MTGLVMVGGGGAACEGDACLLPGVGASDSASDAVDPAREELPVAPPVPHDLVARRVLPARTRGRG